MTSYIPEGGDRGFVRQDGFVPQAERLLNPEMHRIVEQVGIATATLYPGWYTGETEDGVVSADKLRGDLALQTIAAATSQGFRIVTIDGGSSDEFLSALASTDAIVEKQDQEGMSVGRQQAFDTVSDLEGVEVVCWVEPEKVSLVTEGIIDPALSILNDEADIVVPKRDDNAFATYPAFQRDYEQESNRLFNGILRRHGVYPEDAPDIDAWFGPRFFKNTPEVKALFMANYEYKSEVQSGMAQDSMGLWPNALFLPLAAALKRGLRIKSVPVNYVHPAEQTELEQQNAQYVDKRSFQQKNILTAVIHFLRYLEQDRSARIQKV